jgi:hypothetical protein
MTRRTLSSAPPPEKTGGSQDPVCPLGRMTNSRLLPALILALLVGVGSSVSAQKTIDLDEETIIDLKAYYELDLQENL